MNINFFKAYTENRLNNEDEFKGEFAPNISSFLKEIKIDGIKLDSERFKGNKAYNNLKQFNINRTIDVGEEYNLVTTNFNYSNDKLEEEKVSNFDSLIRYDNDRGVDADTKPLSNLFENFENELFHHTNDSENRIISLNDFIAEFKDKYNTGIFTILNDYLKKHKYSLNDLLLNHMNESENFLSELKEKSQSVLINSNNIFTTTSFKKFWKFFNTDKINISSLPLLTKIKMYKELKKIKTRSENSSWTFTFFLTVPSSCFISHLLYKKFQNEIRNKNKFFHRYVIKIPLLIIIPTYFLSKSLLTIFYIRQPLISMNEIFSEADCEKENKNSEVRKIRLKLGSSDKMITDREEYNKLMEYLKIGEKNKDDENKIKRFFPNFYFINYKITMMKLKFLILKELSAAHLYIDSISRYDAIFRISYLKTILLFQHFERGIEKSFEKVFEESEINKNIEQKENKFKIRLLEHNSKKIKSQIGENSKISEFKNSLYNIRAIHFDKSYNKTQLLVNIFIFDNIYLLLANHKNIDNLSTIIKLYEIKYHISFLKRFEIRTILSEIFIYHKILIEEEVARDFLDYLTRENSNKTIKTSKKENKNKISIPKEYFTFDEFKRIKQEEKIIFKSNVNNLLPTTFTLSCLSSLTFLKFKKYF